MPPSPVYGSEELAMLFRVLDGSVKVVVESTGALLSEDEMQDLSSRLGKAIMDHFRGRRDRSRRLKKIAIEPALVLISWREPRRRVGYSPPYGPPPQADR